MQGNGENSVKGIFNPWLSLPTMINAIFMI